MEKTLYKVGAVAIALAMVAPVMAFADSGSEGGDGGSLSQTAGVVSNGGESGGGEIHPVLMTASGTKPSIQGGEEGSAGGEQARQTEGQLPSQASATATAIINGRPSIQGGEDAGEGAPGLLAQVHAASQGLAGLENDDAPVGSLTALKAKIEDQTRKLEQAVASTTSKSAQNLVKNTNEVRIAANSLVVSKDLIGTKVGQQVADIAKQVSKSVATTTAAEAQIQSRGFWTNFFFGGDSASANVLQEEVAKNQQAITQLQSLLSQANLASSTQAVLTQQIQTLQTAQTRLQALAQQQKSAWGLFSWRF